jgi:phage-related protein
VAMGTLKKGTDGLLRTSKGNVVNSKNFTSTLQDQWLTAEALTTTLSRYSDESTDLGKRAYAAATDVKTFSMMLETLAAAAGTGWTDTFDIILGDLPEATKLWTNLTNSIGEFIGKTTDARNEMLKVWDDLGGREEMIEGFKAMFDAIGSVLKPIAQAFRDIFPRTTGEQLFELTKNFREFFENIKLSQPTMDLLRRTFAGLFAILDIGWEIVKRIVGVIFDLFSAVGEGSGGFLNVTAAIGDWLVAVDKAITEGGSLAGIFESLGAVLKVPLEIINALASAFFSMFDGADPEKAEGVAGSMSKLNEALKPLRGIMDVVEKAWGRFLDLLGKVRDAVEPAFTKVLDFLGNFGSFIAEKFENIDWNAALAAIQTGLIGGLFLKLKQFFDKGVGIDVGGGMLKNLNASFEALTDNLKALQRGIQVATLLAIAGAIALLAGGILILSSIPAEKLNKAMSAVAIGLAQLVGAIALLSKVGTSGFAQMPLIAGSMILLATSVVILAAAMKIMATMSWEELAKGLAGVAGALVAVAGATQLMNGPKLLAAGLALIPLAIGVNLLGVAVKMFATMSWEELGKGLLGVAAALAIVGMAVYAIPPIALTMGPSLIAIAFGMTLLAGAISAFGNMDLKTMFQGLLGVGAALAIIGGAMALIPPSSALLGPSLIAMAIGLNLLGAAVGIFGNMDIMTLVKGLGGIGAALAILAGGMFLMQGSIGGAAALLAAAAAFAILGPAIAFMGQLKWSTLLKGLGAMVAILAVLAIAGALAAAPITALGGALAVLGLGMLAISAALSLFVVALSTLGEKGPTAIAAMVAAFGAFLLVLPKMIIDFVKGLVTVLAEIAKLAPAIATALVSILGTLLQGLATLSPQIAEAIAAIVSMVVTVLAEQAPQLIAAGFLLLTNLLTGIKNNIGQLLTMATDIVVTFITGLGNNAPRIVQAGVTTLVKFIGGITNNLGRLLPAVAKMITTFLNGVTSHIPAVVKSAANLIVKFLNRIAAEIPRFVRAGTNIILGFMDGIQDAVPRLAKKALSLAKTFLDTLSRSLVKLADIGFQAIIDFLHGIARSIRSNKQDLFEAGLDIATAIVEGIVDGLGFVAQKIIRPVIEKLFSWMPGAIKKLLGIHSPSTVFAEIGEQTMMGFVVGVENTQPALEGSIESAADNVIDAAKSSFGNMPDLLGDVMDMEPVITPVLDLTQVEKDAQKIGDISNVVPITAAGSFGQAAATSQEVSAAQRAAEEAAAAGGVSFSYEQNNYSPEALSDVEIYRQTKNQLSQVKAGLGLVS